MQACNKTLFWGGGPMKMYAYNCFFFIVFIARLHFDRFVDCNYVPPRFTDLQLFSRGGVQYCKLHFTETNVRTWKKMQEQQSGGLQIAAELQKIKNANWKCVGPQLPGISNTFYTFSAPFLSFPHVTQRYRRYIIPCKLLENP